MTSARPDPDASVAETRTYVELLIGLEVWAHKLHQRIHGPAHEHVA